MPDEPGQMRKPCQLIGYPVRYKNVQADSLEPVTPWLDGKVDNLYLYGPQGTGKTHLAAAAMAHSRLDKSYFVRVPELLLEFQSSVKEHDEVELLAKYSQGESNYNGAVIVGRLFDDVAAHRISDFGLEMFNLLLDRLYSNCSKGNIFTGNLTPKQILDTMGERISSRLCGL